MTLILILKWSFLPLYTYPFKWKSGQREGRKNRRKNRGRLDINWIRQQRALDISFPNSKKDEADSGGIGYE